MRFFLCLCLGGFLLSCSQTERASVLTDRVVASDFEHVVSATGSLKAVRSTQVTIPPDAGSRRTISWLADSGSLVEEGDVLVQFDDSEMKRDLQEAKNDTEIASIQIDSARQDLKFKKLKNDDELRLLEAKLEKEKKFAPRDAGLFAANDVLDAEAEVKFLQFKKEMLARRQDRSQALAEAELALLNLTKERGEMAITREEKSLETVSLKAPHAGRFYLVADWQGNKQRIGSIVWPGMPIGELPDASEMEAVVYVLESDAAGVKVGLPAEIELEGLPGRWFSGRVKQIQALAQAREPRSPVKFFEVVLSLDETETRWMRPAGFVSAKITVLSESQVLTVPNQAVFREGEDVWVYVMKSGTAVKQPVELGIRGRTRSVVVSGLSEGDEIALNRPKEAP